MSKTLTIKHENKTYLLEFNRNTALRVEHAGFDVSQVGVKPLTMIPIIVSGAFIMHNPFIKQNEIDSVFKSISNKNEFIMKLVEMYQEAGNTLLEQPDEETGKNSTWTTDW